MDELLPIGLIQMPFSGQAGHWNLLGF